MSVKEGNIRFYRINRDHALYPELRSIVYKTAGLADALREALAEIGPLELAFIYGSVAKNLERFGSDVDVMIIGDVEMDALHEALNGVEQRLSREINATVYSREEWDSRTAARQAFITDVLKGEKIFLIGDESGLGTIGCEPGDRAR